MSSQQGAGARWLRGIVSLVIVLGAFAAGWFLPPKLGLDLSGGTQIVLQTQDSDDGKVKANAENTDQVIEVLRQRIDSLGVSEATMSRSGEDRIIVELPGVQDPTEAAEIIGQTAQLTVHPVVGAEAPAGGMGGMPGMGEIPGMEGAPGGGAPGGGAPAPVPGGDSANPPVDEARAPADGTEGEGSAEPAPEESAPAEGEGQEQAPQGEVYATLPDDQGQQLQLGKPAIQGDQISSAEAVLDQTTGTQWQVNVEFAGEGRSEWTEVTKQACEAQPGTPERRIAIVLDEQIISAPEVTQDGCPGGQTGGSTTITSSTFDAESSEDLAVLIEGGSLPLPVTEIQRQTVGPTLGADAIQASLIAGAVGIALTALYITVAYRLVGFLASVALACYTLIAYAALVALGATLTLPGLAGFVLAIGMAIDANVLIFERAREEYQQQKRVYDANKSAGMQDATEAEAKQAEAGVLSRRRRRAIPPNLQKAFVSGTKKAWSAVLDTNVTTMIAAVLLFFLASGTVQGFGVTLAIGTIASMVSALIIARVLVEWAVRRAVVRKRPDITGLSRISKVRQWLLDRNPDLMKWGRVGLTAAGLVLVVAVVGVLVRPPNFGVEFTGGRVMDFTTNEQISVTEARQVVSDEGGQPNAVVQESGDSDISVRTGPLNDTEAHQVEDALAEAAGGAERVSDEGIGPSLGNELRNKALLALGAALILQMIYLAWRFRWSFGVSAMAQLFITLVTVVGLFVWLGKPIDGVFLAALLSVIGFTVNDSVVVFDRIRDEWARDSSSPFRKIANLAILNTIPRTVNTAIGGIFILATLALAGGSTLRDFSIAMLVGLIVGTIATVFVGAPLAEFLQRYDKTPPPHVVKEKKAKQRKDLRAAREDSDGAVV